MSREFPKHSWGHASPNWKPESGGTRSFGSIACGVCGKPASSVIVQGDRVEYRHPKLRRSGPGSRVCVRELTELERKARGSC